MVQWKELLARKPDKMGLIPVTNMLEGENQVLQVILCHLLLYCSVYATPANKQINKQIKIINF